MKISSETGFTADVKTKEVKFSMNLYNLPFWKRVGLVFVPNLFYTIKMPLSQLIKMEREIGEMIDFKVSDNPKEFAKEIMKNQKKARKK